MGQGNAGIGRNPDGGRDTRDDLKRDSGRDGRRGFLPAASENKGIAPLESDHGLAPPGLLDQ